MMQAVKVEKGLEIAKEIGEEVIESITDGQVVTHAFEEVIDETSKFIEENGEYIIEEGLKLLYGLLGGN